MDVNIERIVEMVTREVLRQLGNPGAPIIEAGSASAAQPLTGVARIDMSKYKTPLITERDMLTLHELTREILVPQGTILTPRARDLIRKKNITILYEN